MAFQNGFRGQRGSAGAVQTDYKDHPAIGIPGMLAFASDIRQIDSFLVGETDGIAAGKGVRLEESSQDAPNLQTPPFQSYLPTSGSGTTHFAGILIYDESIQSDENGVPGWANGRLGRVVMPQRGGGRVYIKARETIEITDSVNWVIVAPTDESYEVGEFSPAALGGGAAGTSLVISDTIARWVRGALADGDVAILELLGTFVAPVAT